MAAKGIKKVTPKKISKLADTGVLDEYLPHNDSESPEQVVERMAKEHAQLIGSMLLEMEADPKHFYNIRMKAGRCIIERMGIQSAMVMEYNLHDALVAMRGAQ